jgi:hypothetical protein
MMLYNLLWNMSAEGSFRVYVPITITQLIVDRGFIDFDLDTTPVQPLIIF